MCQNIPVTFLSCWINLQLGSTRLSLEFHLYPCKILQHPQLHTNVCTCNTSYAYYTTQMCIIHKYVVGSNFVLKYVILEKGTWNIWCDKQNSEAKINEHSFIVWNLSDICNFISLFYEKYPQWTQKHEDEFQN